MKRSLIALGVVATLALSVTAAMAGPGGTDRPFKGNSSGTTTSSCTPAGDVCTSSSSGTHTSSHMGRGTYSIASTQTWGPGPMPDHGFSDCSTSMTGSVTLVAANGDELSGSIETGSYVCEDVFGTRYVSHLEVKVTGGTGRFLAATGMYAVDGVSVDADFPTTPGEFSDTGSHAGTISY